MQDLDR
jgi:serine/threonine-protein phosphatase 4 catalytic subunit